MAKLVPPQISTGPRNQEELTETSCFFQILDNGKSPETAPRVICLNSAIFREPAVRILVGVVQNVAENVEVLLAY
jgi:hypothetical protein